MKNETIKISISKSEWFWFLVYIILLAIIWDTQHWAVSLAITLLMFNNLVHGLALKGFGKIIGDLRKKIL